MSEDGGRRARKKQQTRSSIADAAQRLFAERGFDLVTVAEVADAADVAEKTVYNHFPTKEDLVFDQMDSFEAALVGTIRERSAGRSALDAYAEFLRERFQGISSVEAAAGLAANARIIMGSSALQAREEFVFGRLRDAVASVLIQETAVPEGRVEPFIAASAMVSLHRSLLRTARDHVLAGRRGAGLAKAIEAQRRRGVALLAHGLGTYPPG